MTMQLNTNETMTNSDVVRVHRDITKFPKAFEDFNEDENLIKSIMVYTYLKFKNDIFGFTKLDPIDFGKTMGYSKSTLFEKVENPFFTKGMNPKKLLELKDSNSFLYETRIENALYRMLREKIIFKNHSGENKNETYEGLGSLSILDNLNLIIDKSNRNKKYYDLKFNDEFFQLLHTHFSHIYLKSFTDIRDKNQTKLYFFLIDLKERADHFKQSIYKDYSLDFLCDLAGIGKSVEYRDKKKRLKNAFAFIIDKSTELNCSLNFEKYGVAKCQPVISFDFSKNISLNDKAILINNEKVNYCKNELKLKLFELFGKLYPAIDNERKTYEFEKWLQAENLDFKFKYEVYVSIIHKFFEKNANKYCSANKLITFCKFGKIDTEGLF